MDDEVLPKYFLVPRTGFVIFLAKIKLFCHLQNKTSAVTGLIILLAGYSYTLRVSLRLSAFKLTPSKICYSGDSRGGRFLGERYS